MLVSEFKEVGLKNGTFPEGFLNILPVYCDCGAENDINVSLTQLNCTSPRCVHKIVRRLELLLKELSVKNLGSSKCLKFIDKYGIRNPLCIFMYEPEDGPLYDGASDAFSESIYAQFEDKRSMLLWEYVRLANLPYIRDSAMKLFSDYSSLPEFYEDMEAGGIDFIQNKLGIGVKNSEYEYENTGEYEDEEDYDMFAGDDDAIKTDYVSVTAVRVFETLTFFKEDLLEPLGYFNEFDEFIEHGFIKIRKLSTGSLNICISTAVGAPFRSKQDFVAKMNSTFSDVVHLNFLSSVSKNCDYLIWSKVGAPTNKVDKATAYGIPILTGAEFVDLLNSGNF